MPTPKELQEAHHDLLRVQHLQWLNNPVTQSLIRLLEGKKEEFVTVVAQTVLSPGMSDSHFRHSAVSVRDYVAVLKLVTDTEVFIRLLTEKPQPLTQPLTNSTE